MRKLPQIVPISYRDTTRDIALRCYADTLVYLKRNHQRILIAARIGGYPEQVRGMSDAVIGGISLESTVEDRNIVIGTLVKQYRRKLTHDGIYAESTIIAIDDDKCDAKDEGKEEDETQNKSAQKQKKYIFCKSDDRKSLFDEIDSKVSVPLIPEFTDYIIDELLSHNLLVKLEVLTTGNGFDAYMLMTRHDEQDVIDIVNHGLKTGRITIPNCTSPVDAFKDITTVSKYLNEYGTPEYTP